MERLKLNENINKKLKNKDGVTLIALVITTIVLLILASITLTLALDEDGIIRKAIGVTKEYKQVEKNELTELGKLENDLSDIIYNKNTEPKIETVSITFNANGGKGKMEKMTVEKGDKVTLPENEFDWDYHGFAKWNTSSNGDGEEYLNGSQITVENDIVLYAMWADYGTTIQNPYGDIYSSLDSKVPIKGADDDNVGYVPRLSKLINRCGTFLHSCPYGRTANDPGTRALIINGANTNTLIKEVSDTWIGIRFHACYSTTDIDLSNLQLIFKDHNYFNLQDAVNNNYIEPLVICESKPFILDDLQTFYWRDFGNLISGNSTDVSSYSLGLIFFKVKTKSSLTGISFSTNKDWDTKGDGLEIVECNDLELSIDPF